MLLQRGDGGGDADDGGGGVNAGLGAGSPGAALWHEKDAETRGDRLLLSPQKGSMRQKRDGKGGGILDESAIAELPWGVVMLLGGGFALAEAAKESGLAAFMAKSLIGLQGLSPVTLLFVIVCLSILQTTHLPSLPSFPLPSRVSLTFSLLLPISFSLQLPYTSDLLVLIALFPLPALSCPNSCQFHLLAFHIHFPESFLNSAPSVLLPVSFHATFILPHPFAAISLGAAHDY